MENKTTNRMVLITAAILIVVGAVLLFVPQIRLQHITYFMCGVIVVGGIYSIVRYFMSNAFREASDYGFSGGVFLCVIGIAGFMKTEEIVAFFPVVISLISLLFGVILLQDALDLKRLLSRIWILIFILAAVVILTSMIVLIDPFTGTTLRQSVGNYLMFGTGVTVLASKLILSGSYKGFEKREKKQTEAIENLARKGKLPETEPVQAGADETEASETDIPVAEVDVPDKEVLTTEELTESEVIVSEDQE